MSSSHGVSHQGLRTMIFIDGENLVCRYQAMIAKGFVPRSKVHHLADCYVWHEKNWIPHIPFVARAYFYTSFVGTDDRLSEISAELKKLQYMTRDCMAHGSADTLYPVIFKKSRKDQKSKGIDIQMSVDILSHVYQDNVDAIALFTGDGDYLPIISEAVRRGKRVFVSAFSDGLNPKLREVADSFHELDARYFEHPAKSQ